MDILKDNTDEYSFKIRINGPIARMTIMMKMTISIKILIGFDNQDNTENYITNPMITKEVSFMIAWNILNLKIFI